MPVWDQGFSEMNMLSRPACHDRAVATGPGGDVAVYGCRSCRAMISLSLISEGNPAVDETKGWTRQWQQCRGCGALWCAACSTDRCPECAGELWVPDEEARLELMFPRLPAPPDAAADAASRTWQGDLRCALDEGLPVLARARIVADVPDLLHHDTRQLYLRWLGVLCWVAGARRMIGQQLSVQVDTVLGGVNLMVGRGGTSVGWRDPYGPGAMGHKGRWRSPAPVDLAAFALRCGWEERGSEMKPDVAEELDLLAVLEDVAADLRGDVERLSGPLGPLGTLEQRDADQRAWEATLRPDDAAALSLLANGQTEVVVMEGLEAIGRLDLSALHSLVGERELPAVVLDALGTVGDSTSVDLLLELEPWRLGVDARVAWAGALGDLEDVRAVPVLRAARERAKRAWAEEIDLALRSLEAIAQRF